MNYKDMLMEAKKKGLTNENKMWESVAAMGPMLEIMEHEHPDEYWSFLRNQHELMYGPHFDPQFSEQAVGAMHSMGSDGKRAEGPHWSKADVIAATAKDVFPPGTTDCDKYVAYNAAWHDLHRGFSDPEILKAAHLLYFDDDDAPAGKIWKHWVGMMA